MSIRVPSRTHERGTKGKALGRFVVLPLHKRRWSEFSLWPTGTPSACAVQLLHRPGCSEDVQSPGSHWYQKSLGEGGWYLAGTMPQLPFPQLLGPKLKIAWWGGATGVPTAKIGPILCNIIQFPNLERTGRCGENG